ncbi:hypothetical protein Cgig2_020699 [Carnegiea gigantea]|uniref:Retrotransposon gag domain-containing protein n=1 Tax=Carnegiea gigantea TaxID=171969 RepID=A0A9Q1GRQ3_9CARY|nr:hypothetical protein Cgig2_020699 [Carnegiea gigantea]
MEKDREPATQIVPMVPQLIFTQQLKIPVNLSRSNWEQWSTFVETGLDSLRKGKYLTEESQATEDWKAEGSSIRMILWNAMEPDILSTVHTFKTTKKMWDHLQSTYSKKTSMTHIYAVSQAYAKCEQGDATLIEYFTKFKKLSDEMRDLFPFGADSTSVWEQLNTLTFIGGMSSRYSSARPILLGQTIIPSLSATYHLLWEMFPSDRIDSSPITETSALVANSYKDPSSMLGFAALAVMAKSWQDAAPKEDDEQNHSSGKWVSDQATIARAFSGLLQQAFAPKKAVAFLESVLSMISYGASIPRALTENKLNYDNSEEDDSSSLPLCIDDALMLLWFIMRSITGIDVLVELKVVDLLAVWAGVIADWHGREEVEDLPIFDCIKEIVNIRIPFLLLNSAQDRSEGSISKDDSGGDAGLLLEFWLLRVRKAVAASSS